MTADLGRQTSAIRSRVLMGVTMLKGLRSDLTSEVNG